MWLLWGSTACKETNRLSPFKSTARVTSHLPQQSGVCSNTGKRVISFAFLEKVPIVPKSD